MAWLYYFKLGDCDVFQGKYCDLKMTQSKLVKSDVCYKDYRILNRLRNPHISKHHFDKLIAPM